MDILDKLIDLHKQATAERSHYYVAATTKEAVAEIILLRSKISLMSEGQKPSDNKQMTAALWRAICSKSVKAQCKTGGVWVPLTRQRLNAAIEKINKA